MTMNLREMQAEVSEVNKTHGWYDEERTFGEGIALLHSEVSEALEAWRQWGLDDRTPHPYTDDVMDDLAEFGVIPKPEGVGSELADVLIRLIDMAERYDVDLQRETATHGSRFGIQERFGDQLATLHLLISFLQMAHDEGYDLYDTTPKAMAKIFVYLVQVCEFNHINLEAEYARKLAYNKTRPYRHGNKAL